MSEFRATILVVDDDPSIRRLLRRALEKETYRVLEAEDGEQLTTLLNSESIDLITLDLSLGAENGLELAREIRSTSNIGIIIVSGKGELIDTVVGLEIGADDYITKPFELRDVIARIGAVLRRSRDHAKQDEPHQPPPRAEKIVSSGYRFNGWSLNTVVRELRDQHGQVCELTTGEYDLLHLLARSSRQVLSRDQIMDQIRGHQWAANDRTIDNQVARLRKKISADSSLASAIKTIRGAGYMFTPEVSILD